MSRTQNGSFRALSGCLVLAALMLSSSPVFAAEGSQRVSVSQKRAVETFLNAVASGNPQAVAMTIHPDDIEGLRTRILTKLREEAKQNDSTLRVRLFGQGLPLAEIERLTAPNFYAALSRKLWLTARDYQDADYVGALPDRGGLVQVVLRGKQPEGRRDVEVVNVVTIKPWGKGWKAALPSEIEAQIDDLTNARKTTFAMVPRVIERSYIGQILGNSPAANATGTASPPPAAAPDATASAGIVTLLDSAEKSLADGNCEDYYKKAMSPNFRRVTSKKALESLIASCTNSLGTREMLSSTLRIVRGLSPNYEY